MTVVVDDDVEPLEEPCSVVRHVTNESLVVVERCHRGVKSVGFREEEVEACGVDPFVGTL